MTPAERRWCWVLSAALALATSLPSVVGFAMENDVWKFTGFVFAVEDGNSYLAKMMQGASGAWLFQTPYTTFPQRGTLAFMPYLLLGKLAAEPALPEQLISLFHLFRIAVTPWAIFATYRFVSLWIADVRLRQWTTVLACAGGGLGWLAIFLQKNTLPLEFYSPEAFGFLSFLGLPHLLVSRALLLDGMRHHIQPPTQAGMGLQAGLRFLAAGIVQPIVLGTIFVVVLAHGLIRWIGHDLDVRRWLRRTAKDLLPAAVLAAAYAAMLATDPYLQVWARQNRILSPPPGTYLVSYGLAIALAIRAAVGGIRAKSFQAWLPLSWVAALPILAYAPVNLQRRLPEGVWIALLILVALGWQQWGRRLLPARVMAAVFAGVSLPATVLLLLGGLRTASARGEPAFFPRAEAETADWLRITVEPREVVLSTYRVGNRLPTHAPVRVVVGHGPESADLDVLLPAIARFYSTAGDLERQNFLADQQVAFVFWGPSERELGNWIPANSAYLELAYSAEGYEVYRVR